MNRRFTSAWRAAAVLPVLVGLLAGCGAQIAGSAAPAVQAQGESGGSGTSTRSGQPSTATPDLAALEGTWEGTYTCNQGETGMRLIIKPVESGSLPATFEFFPLPSNKQAQAGSYAMRGAVAAGHIVFRGQRWINQPEGYSMVDFAVTTAGPDTLSGTVVGSGCSAFTVRRASS